MQQGLAEFSPIKLLLRAMIMCSVKLNSCLTIELLEGTQKYLLATSPNSTFGDQNKRGSFEAYMFVLGQENCSKLLPNMLSTLEAVAFSPKEPTKFILLPINSSSTRNGLGPLFSRCLNPYQINNLMLVRIRTKINNIKLIKTKNSEANLPPTRGRFSG